MLRRRRLQWLDHVSRMSDDRLPKKLLFGWLPQRRPAHEPQLRWRGRVTAHLKQLGVAYFAGQGSMEKHLPFRGGATAKRLLFV